MTPEPAPTRTAAEPIGRRIALNRHRQAELYGDTLAMRVRHLVELLGITQARLARTLGMSPAMLSQLVSGRRIKIGDPAVLARFQMIDHRCAGFADRPTADVVDRLLVEVARARWRWLGADLAGPGPAAGGPMPRVRRPACPSDALRRVCPPAQLAAAAAVLGAGFPELAEVLRRAAARR